MNEIGSVEPGSLQLSIPSRISVLMSIPMDFEMLKFERCSRKYLHAIDVARSVGAGDRW